MTSQSCPLFFSICFVFTTRHSPVLNELLGLLWTRLLMCHTKNKHTGSCSTPFAGLGEIQVMPWQLLDKHFILSLHFQQLSPCFSRTVIQEGVQDNIFFFLFEKRTSTKIIFLYIGEQWTCCKVSGTYFHLRSLVCSAGLF